MIAVEQERVLGASAHRPVVAPRVTVGHTPYGHTRSAKELHDQVRGLYPWPAAVTQLDGLRCKVLKTSLPGETTAKTPGSVVRADKSGLWIACGDGKVIELVTLQPDGKKAMDATAFLLGHPLKV